MNPKVFSFMGLLQNGACHLLSLGDGFRMLNENSHITESDVFFVVMDSCKSAEGVSWPVRNLLLLIQQQFKMNVARVICIRQTHVESGAGDPSMYFEVELSGLLDPSVVPQVTGFERNSQGRMAPFVLRELMSLSCMRRINGYRSGLSMRITCSSECRRNNFYSSSRGKALLMLLFGLN